MSTSTDNWQLNSQLEQLEQIETSSTSLISLYIPGKQTQLTKIIKTLTEEQGIAKNIKSSQTRNAVTSALTSILRYLKTISKIPSKGIALFAGNDGNKQILKVIEPNENLPQHTIYKCDKKFQTDILRKQMLKITDCYGFVILSGTSVLFANLIGSQLNILNSWKTTLPNKHRRGGQSAPRFQRQRI